MYVGHMLFLTLYMTIAMSCSSRFCRGVKIKREIVAEIETTFGRDHTLIIEGHEKL